MNCLGGSALREGLQFAESAVIIGVIPCGDLDPERFTRAKRSTGYRMSSLSQNGSQFIFGYETEVIGAAQAFLRVRDGQIGL